MNRLLYILFFFSFINFSVAQVSTIRPKNNQINNTDTVIFNWNPIENTLSYELIISDNMAFSNIIYSSGNISFTSDTLTNMLYGKYFWKVKHYTIVGEDSSNINSFNIFDPNSISNIGVWLTPDSIKYNPIDSLINKWTDATINNNFAFQNDNNLQPKLSTNKLNNYNSISFDGVNDFLELIDSLENPFSLYFLIDFDTLDNIYSLFSATSHNDGLIYFFNPNMLALFRGTQIKYNPFLAKTNFYSIHHGNTVLEMKRNESNMSLIGSGSIVNIKIKKIGTSTYRPFKGRIYEIIGFNDTINQEQRYLTEQYLRYKYAPPVNLGYDINIPHSFCDTTIDAGARFTDYLWSTGDTTQTITVNQAGQYSVTVSDIFGYVSSDTILVQYPFSPFSDTAFCLTDTVSMNTGLDHAYTFLWSDMSTDSLLEVYASGTYWVEITDSTLSACSIRDTFIVTVDSFPVLASLGSDTSMCSGERITLQDESGSGYTYNWNTGSSDSAIVISAPGTYSLTVTNNNTCTAIDSVDLLIKGIRPTVAFSNTTVCNGDSMNFVDMSFTILPDQINNILWDFNDGDSSIVSNPNHLFADFGNFPVTLQIYSDSGCYADTTIDVHVRDLPHADFLPFNACNGKTVFFGDSSDIAEGNIVFWEWDFDDGNYSSLQNPGHIFDSTGTYYTQLFVSDIYGCSDSISFPVTVRLSPVADFSFEESCLGQKTYFTELTEMPPYAEIIYRRWQFGDSNYSLLENPEHLYGSTGAFAVQLINRSVNGCVDSVTKVIMVHPFPTAGFISENACEDHEVCFTDTSSALYSNIIERLWNFGIGGSSTDSIACTIFSDTGSFQISLTVTSEFGCSSIAYNTINVYPNPISDFSIVPEYGVPPLDVQFYNYSTGAIAYEWFFGDGNSSTTSNPLYTYTTESVFNIMLISNNEFNCTDTAFGNVYVIPSILDLVLTKLSVTDSVGYLYLNIEFENNGTRNIREIAFDARIGNNIPVRETWSGLLQPADNESYSFTSAFSKPITENIRTICVDATVLDAYGQEDINIEDNSICYSLIDGFFIASVYPSPADDYISTNISIPDDGDINLIISSEDGKIVRKGTFTDLDAGTLRLQINVESLSSGIYYIKAFFKDKEAVISFVKE